MSLIELILANTPEEKAEAERRHRAEQAAKPSDFEVLAGFLRQCTTMDGQPLDPSDFHIKQR